VTPNTITPRLAAIYPTARIRGRAITRLPERTLGWTVLNAPVADELGREQLGWFVGGHPGIARAAEQFGRLDANPEGGVWVVVPITRDLAETLFDRWPHSDYVTERPRLGNLAWRSRKVWVATSEDLKHLLPFARSHSPGVAGLIVLDPECIMYKARGGKDRWGRKFYNDRPQHVVNFRASLGSDGWQPPILLLTQSPAKAINTEVVARAFCLNGFRFIAGDSFSCWDAPIEHD
jgi:hypothetical protein